MQHWILCMSSWYCLSPFRKLLLKWVHRILIRWISIIRLLRESPTLTSLLISFTRSISHLSLAVLVTDCQFWRLLRQKADNGVDKDLGISDDWIADNVAFQTRSSHGVWQPLFSNYFWKVNFLLQVQDHVCSDQHFNQVFDSRSTASLQDCAPWQTYQDSHPELHSLPEFWWQLVGGRVLRYRLISVQSRLLLLLQHYMISSPRNVSIVLCQIRGLVTAAAHRFSSSLLFCLCWTFSM